MGNICKTAKAFEKECADDLVSGSASAQETKILYPSQKTSDLDETYFSKRFLVLFRQLGLNGVSVIFPVEGYTGADIEIHVLLKHGGWCGLRLQAKRAIAENSGLTFKELAHPNGTGEQNATLFETSIEDGMCPLYLYYIPRNLVESLQNDMQVSGAMVGTAWDARDFIEKNITSSKTIVQQNTATLSSILCNLDKDDRHFIQAVERLFQDHLDESGKELDEDLDNDFPELYEVEEPVLDQAKMFKVARTAPESVVKYFEQGVWPKLQDRPLHGGAILINRRLFLT